MGDTSRMLACIAEDLITQALDAEVPWTSCFLLQGDIWKDNGRGEQTRTMPVSSEPLIPNWYLWLVTEGKDRWFRSPWKDELGAAVQRDEHLTALLADYPPSIPGAGKSPGQPTQSFDEWVYSTLVVPLVARALFPPEPREVIDVPKVASRVVLTYQYWRNHSGRLPLYAIAPLTGIRLPSAMTFHFDSETLVRPVRSEDITALLNPIPSHPLSSLVSPLGIGGELLSMRHVIEYRPKTDVYPDTNDYSHGIIRVLTALRCVFGAAVTTPWSVTMSDVPTPMMAGGATPGRGLSEGWSRFMAVSEEWDVEREEPLRRVYKSLGNLSLTEQLAVAIEWFHTAANASDARTRLLSAWIGLEALYGGGKDQGEITYKICLRAAFYLVNCAATATDVDKMFHKLQGLYKWRSVVVHGAKSDENMTPPSLMDAAKSSVEMLRLTLQAALSDGTFPTANRLDKKLRTSITRSVRTEPM